MGLSASTMRLSALKIGLCMGGHAAATAENGGRAQLRCGRKKEENGRRKEEYGKGREWMENVTTVVWL
uniref:Secreted protein n=1 Tax=Oryza meridionalis TaxID=40149 RepID=A0A0E0EWK8_9ORYZ